MSGGGGKWRIAGMLVAAALMLSGTRASAQEAPPPPSLPQQPSSPPTLGAPEPLMAPAPAGPGPATPVENPVAGLLPPPLTEPADPGPNGWGPDPYGTPFGESQTSDFWFVDFEVQIVRPFVKNALVGTVVFPNGSTNTISPPSAPLSWTGAPYFEVGYRLPNSLGQFTLSYRFLYSQGTQNVLDINAVPYSLDSHAIVNFGDFDYGTVPYMIYPHWFLQARIGLRLADLYFDTRAVSATNNQFDSNNFFSGGPHTRLELWRRFALVPGLSMFGRLDGAVVVGQITQHYNQALTSPDGTTDQGAFYIHKTQTVPILIVQAGISYTPPRMSNLHLSTGYQYEEWWDVGEIDNYPSRGAFLSNGLFLRAVLDF